MLVVFKSAPILKRALKVKHELLQLYVLKVSLLIFFSWKTFLGDTVLFLVVINILSLYIIMTEGFWFKHFWFSFFSLRTIGNDGELKNMFGNPSWEWYTTICWLSLLLVVSLAMRGFSPGTRFSSLLNSQQLEIPVRSGIRQGRRRLGGL